MASLGVAVLSSDTDSHELGTVTESARADDETQDRR